MSSKKNNFNDFQKIIKDTSLKSISKQKQSKIYEILKDDLFEEDAYIEKKRKILSFLNEDVNSEEAHNKGEDKNDNMITTTTEKIQKELEDKDKYKENKYKEDKEGKDKEDKEDKDKEDEDKEDKEDKDKEDKDKVDRLVLELFESILMLKQEVIDQEYSSLFEELKKKKYQMAKGKSLFGKRPLPVVENNPEENNPEENDSEENEPEEQRVFLQYPGNPHLFQPYQMPFPYLPMYSPYLPQSQPHIYQTKAKESSKNHKNVNPFAQVSRRKK